MVGDGGKGVSAELVWKEVVMGKIGSCALEQGGCHLGPRDAYLSAADEFDLRNGAWYLSGGSGGTPPSASWPNQAWKTPSASGRPQTRR